MGPEGDETTTTEPKVGSMVQLSGRPVWITTMSNGVSLQVNHGAATLTLAQCHKLITLLADVAASMERGRKEQP